MDIGDVDFDSKFHDDTTEFFMWTKERKVFSSKETNIDWLCLFGHSLLSKALDPLGSHRHKNKYEVVITISGLQQYHVEGRDYHIYGGEAFFTFPSEVHRSSYIAENPGEFYWFQIDIVKMDDYLQKNDDYYLKEIYLNLLQIRNRVCKISKEDISVLKESFLMFSSGNTLENARGYYLLMSFLNSFIRENIKSYMLDKGEKDVSLEIKRTLDYIDNKIEEPITLEELANIASLSLSGFKLRFKQEIGISPRDYINIKKIDIAKKMLIDERTNDMKVTDIAHDLGFSSSDYFATVFKRYTGVSPSKYKEIIK